MLRRISNLLLAACIFVSGISAAHAADSGGRISARVEDDGAVIKLLIAPADPGASRIFVLGEPNRVVVDLSGVEGLPQEDVVPAPNPLIDRLRFGVHPDKIRIVADIKSRDVPPPTLEANGKGIAILLPVSSEARTAFVSDQASLKLSETAPGAAVDAPPSSTTTALGQQLTELAFERTDEGAAPLVRLGLTKRPTFSFQKADPRTYRLTLPKCAVGSPHLAFPHYPPDDFVGFSIVEVRQAGEDTEVLIGVDRDFKIAPTTTERAILIRSIPRG